MEANETKMKKLNEETDDDDVNPIRKQRTTGQNKKSAHKNARKHKYTRQGKMYKKNVSAFKF